MNVPTMSNRRTMVTTGTTSPAAALRALAPVHPFTQQLDVVVASSDADDALAALRTTYYSCACTLTRFIEYARPLVRGLKGGSDVLALGMPGPDSTDTWSLDARGVLTLAVDKITYEGLGIVGERLPWEECRGTYVISLSLAHDDSVTALAPLGVAPLNKKQHAALADWDARRGPWRVLYTLQAGPHANPLEDSLEHVVSPTVTALPAIHLPTASLHARAPHDADAQTEWEEDISALFEWTGMACLHSQRLRAGDATDPYIAVYAPPAPASVADAAHIRWTGLLSPSFVEDVATALINSERRARDTLAAVAAHGVPTAPAAYVHADTKRAALRAPWAGAEDTWCMLLGKDVESREEGDAWALAESVGKWDKRWG
ncbi:hypothetical protein WOLCODRAFT_140331 [Wolfiporia cocos MD-104 SS10]|uniref:Uncharacterized protein n=1 Tax=Wolfiporia cocos (strain MD-104) TaxID=742152 RepID=A0A2H3J2A6_WOLCO|nr:hypothetical protein WOLCODRAFT_140331 [Wolfiporia cocos MD-104 SS10]